MTTHHKFQTSDYVLRRTDTKPDTLPQETSLYSIGNGFIGIRGVRENVGLSGAERENNVVYLNGVYERRPVEYHEGAYGFPRVSDVRVAVLDCTGLVFEINGRNTHSSDWRKTTDSREFDYKKGILLRHIVYTKDTGEKLEINLENMVSLTRRVITAERIFICAVDFSGSVMIHALIDHPYENLTLEENAFEGDVYDPRAGMEFSGNPWKIESGVHGGNTWTFLYRTISTDIGVVTMDRIVPVTDNADCVLTPAFAGGYGQTLTLEISPDKPAELYRLSCYETDRGERDVDILNICCREMESAQAAGYLALRQEQAGELARFSAQAFVTLPDNQPIEGAINFNTVQLLMATGRDGAQFSQR